MTVYNKVSGLTSKRYLGKLCPKGHEYEQTGKSLRKKCNNGCVECDRLLTNGSKRKRPDDHRIKDNLRKMRDRALSRGLSFDLDFIWFKVNLPSFCPVLGTKLEFGHGFNSPSVDRLDSNKGYTKDNCIIISRRANRIKSDATLAELRKLVKFLEEIYNE